MRHLVIGLAALGLLVGCGDGDDSDPPETKESYATYYSAPRIMADGFEATLDLESVHLGSETRDDDGLTVVDVSLRRDGDCLGRLQLPGWAEPADFAVVDGRDYLRGSATFWGDDADRYAGRWVTTGELASYCDWDVRLAPFTRPIDEQLTSKDGIAEVDGVDTVKVSTPTTGGRLRAWVTVAEPHHVVRLALTGGRSTGQIELSAYDEPVEVTPPPAADVVEFTG